MRNQNNFIPSYGTLNNVVGESLLGDSDKILNFLCIVVWFQTCPQVPAL